MRKIDLQELSSNKIKAAKSLSEKHFYSESYYLAGYAVEMALKACVASQISKDTIPDKTLINKIYTHNFSELVGLAGLKRELSDYLKKDENFAASWSICSEWSPEARYEIKTAMETQHLLISVGDENSGVFGWIKKFW